MGEKQHVRTPLIEASLTTAYTGVSRFNATAWNSFRHNIWTLDYINHGQQRQRIGGSREFCRLSGVAALYAPGCAYAEWWEAGVSTDSSFIMFTAKKSIEHDLRELVGRHGWCHIQDPQHVMEELLRKLGAVWFSRAACFHIQSHGLFCELLATVLSSERLTPRVRRAWKFGHIARGGDLQTRTEQFIRDQVDKPLRVADLAQHLHMSLSTFSHLYTKTVGESPHRAILRLKMESAKRMLLDERLNVKEIALRLSFSSEFHFSHVFKRMEGLAPHHYLNTMTKKILS